MVQGAVARTSVFAALAIGLLVLVAFTSQPDATDQRRELHDAFASVSWSEPSQVKTFSRQLSEAIDRHPGDPYLPLLGALYARQTGKNALMWLNQALRRNPVNARAELLLADVLASRTRSPGLGCAAELRHA